MFKSKITAFWLCVGIASAAENVNASMDGGWLTDAASQVLTPKSNRVAPVCVMRQEGKVESVEALLAQDGRSCRLAYPKVRFVKINVTRFGEPSADEAGVYRLQLERIRFLRP